MKNLLQTTSVSWAQSVKIALEAEGIDAAVLDQNSFAIHGLAGHVRVAVLNDDDLPRAQSVLSGLTPPPSPPPPSWRWQKRGLQMMGLGLVLVFVTAELADRVEPGPLLYGAVGVTGLAWVAGFVLIALGWRVDKQQL